MNISIFSKLPFWSYKKDADIPNEIIIRQIVLYGEVSDMIKLTKLFSKDEIIGVINNLASSHDKFLKRINFFTKIILECQK